MSVKRELIKGTLILTAAGFAARLLGFFNRVYLANLISNAELGRYQLIFPIFMFCMAVSCAGIQVAVSKMVAAYHGAGKKKAIRQTIKSAGITSLIVALLSSGCVIAFSEPISRWILKDISCRGYLVIMAIAIPFAAVHTCVGGYFYGIRHTAVPAVTQLLEQVVRVVTIYLLGAMMYQKGKIDASVAVWGLAAGEIFSCFLTWICYRFSIRSQNGGSGSGEPIRKILRQLWQYGGLLTANRVSVTLLQSTEMILMPVMLAKYYGNTESALSVFGIVTGIVLPVILFPNTVTNAMASLLLPAVAEAEEVHDYRAVSGAIKKSLEYCLLLGLFSGLVFGVCGNQIGSLLFNDIEAGGYIQSFAILCPLMYIQSLLAGALNGLGKMNETLLHHVIASGIRLIGVVVMMPKMGIYGYIAGVFWANAAVTVIAAVRLYQIVGRISSAKRD